ncbi:1767_t:CDS:2, partial [Ambispora leptoticha]
GKIKIWSTAALYDESKENNGSVTGLLCTMGLHTGPVLCVRWSQIEGRHLASGSDDKIVLIWELDSGYGGKVFGSDEQNVENWKISKRLTGHESDVVDIAWSSDNTYLASCGLDNLVFIWDGQTFEKLRKIDEHKGFVKGVAWDPIGKYLATESDDKTMRIWRTSDWGAEHVVKAPFTSSPTTTFFRRLCWSPDGTHLSAANGSLDAIAIAPILVRDEWKADISLVGHNAPIGVVVILFVIPDLDAADRNAGSLGSIIAVGSQDYSISIWATRRSRPITVSQRMFRQSVMDLSWAPNGKDLFACSYDGSVAILRFQDSEFGIRSKIEDKASNEFI